MDYDDAVLAEQTAKKLIRSAPGYEDLADFYVLYYTNEELVDLGYDPEEDWVGQYVLGSVNDDRGMRIAVNIDKHEEAIDLTDTMLHEAGHGLWELLDDEAQDRWIDAIHDQDPEEAFADDFMRLVRGSKAEMNNEELFKAITAI